MDWSSIGATLSSFGLTALGTALGGPAGGIIGSAAGKMVADALGVPATPEAVQAALSADPEMAKAQLAALERGQQAELAELQARLADVQDARHVMVDLSKADSPLAWGPVIVSGILLGMAMAIFGAVAFKWMPDSSLVTGAAITWVTSVTSYWIGSSSGSKRSGDAVRAIAMQTPSLAEQAGVVLGRAVRK